MSTPVEQIKQRLSIVDVVGSYIKLTKAGSSYKALCPFHNEKSPSFNVSPSRDGFYCFGCNRGGDIFTFVEGIEGVEFMDALKILAERAGVELKPEPSESRTERDRLLDLMEEVTLFYQRHMLENKAVKEYLSDRGLTEATIRSFRIGYAPLEWRLAYEHLKGKGFSDQEIERAGLIKTVEGKSPYDRFRGRVMFPIFDGNGRVVAFSGRVFGEQKNQDGTAVAKYINSPDGLLYDKSSIMFGYDRAKRAIREQNFTILVEGQMDLIMAHQGGTLNAVAVSGTALTEKHLTLLKRLSDSLTFALDADDAGLAATARAFKLALAADFTVFIAEIPEGKDPADYIKLHGEAAWANVIANKKFIITYYMAALASRKYDKARMNEEVAKQVFPLLSAMNDPMKQNLFISEVAKYFADGKDSIAAVREKVAREIQLDHAIINQLKKPEPEPAAKASAKTRRQVAEEEIIGIILWQEAHKEPVIEIIPVRQKYHERIGAHGLTPYSPGEDERRTFAIKAEYKYEHGPTLNNAIDELLDTIEEEVLKEKQAILWQKLSDAEARGAKDEAKTFLEEYQSVAPKIIALEDRRMKRTSI